MRELNVNEIKAVNGGNPALIFVGGAILGGMIYDGLKIAYSQLSNTPKKSGSGGQMQHGKKTGKSNGS